MKKTDRLILFWILLIISMLLLPYKDSWVSLFLLFISALVRGEVVDIKFRDNNVRLIKNMKFISMLIGLTILIYVFFSIIIGRYNFLSNHNLMLKLILLIALPILVIVVKYEFDLYRYYKKTLYKG